MKRILTIVGARPQFIKAAAISHVIKEKYADKIAEDILHTGQHYDDAMSGQFFTELDIPLPKYNLGIGSAPHGKQTGLMMSGIEEILLNHPYDGVLVYGDTNSTLAGALAAAKLHLPVYHVEAGLRSLNRNMPEEINRVVTDHVASLLFAPTETAMHNLWNEGVAKENVIFSGDVMYDNVLRYSSRALQSATLPLDDSPFILATLHRDFNTDNPSRLKHILSALNTVSELLHSNILFPVHPRTGKTLDSMDSTLISPHICRTAPLSYLQTLAALQKCSLVITDSGGLQKEACFCGKTCVVLRPETEWSELIADGNAILADADEEKIVAAADALSNRSANAVRHFGDGHAAETIVDTMTFLSV
ncbi:MAG: UDP-N-acetylglucosamine 2-epimerase (non-hydrolyzing) [Bacteroidales bacterium]|nr:UDP-N-acetylglucosamine 2-epimerase (non-hydrolyzing) [Bacteroidales bacterium]